MKLLNNTKNKMIYVVCLALLLCLNTLIVPVYAQDYNLVYIDPTSKTVDFGQTFTVNVSCVPVQPIKSFELKVSFNASLLQANSVTKGNFFAGYTSFFNAGTINNNAGSIVNIYDFIIGPGQTSNPGTFIIISFTSKLLYGVSPINLYDVGLTNNVTYVNVTVHNGNITVQGTNSPPNTPIAPSGPSILAANELESFYTSATDPDGDTVQYRFDWNAGGGHDYSGWTSLVPSGQSASLSHSWSSAGTFVVCAQARDMHGSVGNWSTGLTVNIVGGTNGLDQQSTIYDKSNTIFTSRWSAQSFKPSLGTLTKVQLYVGKTGSPTSDLVVSVRSSLTGPDLVSASKSPSSIPSSTSWVDFYFLNYSLNPGNTYYLVVRTSGGSSTQNYLWGYGYYNPYANGSFWMSTNSGVSWTNYASYDFCFKTYGQGGGNSPPNAPTVPSGPASRIIGESGTYSTSATDPDSDQVQYRFDWNAGGGHDYSGWTSLVPSGQSASLSHSWSSAGTYQVRAQAKDSLGNEGPWSSGLTVTVTVSNSPPYAPSNPSPGNHATGFAVNADLSWTGGDPDSDTVTYDVYFGTITTPPKVSTNQSATTYDPGTMSYSTKYYWKIVSWDNHGASTTGQLWDFTTGSSSNNPPNTPSVPTGPATRLTGQSGAYVTSATDPDSDQVQYRFDWNAGGGHDYSGWTSLVPSGQSASLSHSWSSAGTYQVRAQALDEHGLNSSWSTGLTVTVSAGAEVLDQQSTIYDKSNTIFTSRWSGQSFKPSLGTLTKVQLYVGKTGSPTSDLVVSVRSSLTGADLTSVAISSSSISSSLSWVEFNLPDISVTPSSIYYLVVRTSGGTATQNYLWGYGYYTPYANGSFWMSTKSGSSWTGYALYDFCFKTYGT